MTHLDEGAVQAWMHGEAGGERAAIERHLAECASCRDAVAAADAEDRWTLERLSLLDVAIPRQSSLVQVTRGRSQAYSWGRAAAIALFVGVAAVATATPAVRSWFTSLLGSGSATSGGPAVVRPDTVSTVQAAGEGPRGISVMPGERFTVSVRGGDSLTLVLRGVPRADLAVSVGGDDPAAFESREREIEVRAGRSARVEIEVPMGVASVAVTVNGERVGEVRRGVLHRPGQPDATLAPASPRGLVLRRP